MRLWDRHHHGLVEQWRDHKSTCIGRRAAIERDIDLLVAQPRKQVVAQAFLQRQRHARKGLAKGADNARHEGMKRRSWRSPEANLPFLASRGSLRGFN